MLSVAIAKHVLTHPERGIVFVRDPISISDAAQYGLSPLIIYSVGIPGTSIRMLTFSPADKPRSMCSLLKEAWNTAPGLRGYPDTLKISRHLADAAFVGNMSAAGIKVVVAAGDDKQFSALLRVAQDAAMELDWSYGPSPRRMTSIGDLVASAKEHHRRIAEPGAYRRDKDDALRCSQWLALPARHLDAWLPDELDWGPGKWLSTWQGNLAPTTCRYFYDSSGTSWLLCGEGDEVADDGDPDGECFLTEADLGYLEREAVKIVLDCWPNKMSAVADAIGVATRKLQWYLADHPVLPLENRELLLELLGIEYRAANGRYDIVGSRALVAGTAKASAAAYEAISHGGDLSFSREILPRSSAADPSWRYLLMIPCQGQPFIFMVARGSRVADRLDGNGFINFGGKHEESDAFYRDMVHACAKACESPLSNGREMLRFVNRHVGRFPELNSMRYGKW